MEKDLYKKCNRGCPSCKSARDRKLFSKMHYHMLRLAFIFLIFTGAGNGVFAQTANEAEWSGDGYFLKKVVSNTSIQTGVNFSYTILFSGPASASNIIIQDLVPADLEVVSVPTPSDVCGVTPTVNVTGNTVDYSLSGLPGNCSPSGSFTIVVKFLEGVTCDGTSARNNAGIQIQDKWNFTPYVTTIAEAADPWVVSKSIISGAVVNPGGSACGYLVQPGATVTYRLVVTKDNPYYGNVTGQHNMSNAVVTDILPAGASLVSGSCVTQSGNTLTWNVGNLDASVPYVYNYCDIEVEYPVGSFPVGTQIPNELELNGTSCGQAISTTSNETCVEVANIALNTGAQFRKYLSLTNRVPGCQGYYSIYLNNTGNTPLSPFNIDDAIPAGITVNELRFYTLSTSNPTPITADIYTNGTLLASGLNSYYSSGSLAPGISSIQLQMTGSLPAGQGVMLRVYFSIDSNPTGTVISNCASFDGLTNSLTLQDACVDFTVDAGAPKPCLLKEVCSPADSYEPGDIVRFRLRVQNIGSATLSGAEIEDQLNANFNYIGNETHYVSSSFNPPCSTSGTPPAGASAWNGVTPAHSGSNLSWNLPDIDSDCQLFYVAYCGYYGTYGLPYHYIEFDAEVSNTALPGVTPNSYSVSGGNLSTPFTSNTANVLVVASFGQEVEKQVSTDGGNSFASSGTVAPGTNVRYQLNYTNTSNVPVSDINMADLLPLNGSGSDDWLILDRNTSRMSVTDLSYVGTHSTSLIPGGTSPAPTLSYATGDNLCLPGFGINTGCATGTWGSTVDQNMRMEYGTLSLSPATILSEEFDVIVPGTAIATDVACNDFAAVSTSGFLLDGIPQSVMLPPVAANPVCVTVEDQNPISCCRGIELFEDPDKNCCVKLISDCEVEQIEINVYGGTILDLSWNCGTIPAGYQGATSYILSPSSGNCQSDVSACVVPDVAGEPVTVEFTVYTLDGEKCTQRIEVECPVEGPSCCRGVEVFQDPDNPCSIWMNSECEVKQVLINVTEGTISGLNWNCGPIPSGYMGANTFTLTAQTLCSPNLEVNITPDNAGVTPVLEIVAYMANGEKCYHQLEVVQCTTGEPSDCCDALQVFEDEDKNCCARLVANCEVEKVDVIVNDGVISDAAWNCGTLPSGYIGQSNFTFTPQPACGVDMSICVRPNSEDVQPSVLFVVYFSNGESCEKVVNLNCGDPTNIKGSKAASEELTVYPNPSGGALFVRYPNNAIGASILRIIDLDGKVYYSADLSEVTEDNEHRIEPGTLKPGSYLVVFSSKNKVLSTKLTVR